MATGTTPSEALVGGYPVVKLQSGQHIDSKYKCTECELVLREPVQACCGHRFCQSCLEAKLRTVKQMTCKQCEIEGPDEDEGRGNSIITDKDNIYPDRATERELKRMKVICPNKKCKWNGPFKNYEEHFLECQYRKITCSNCRKMVKQVSYENHLNSKCKTKCTNCNALLPSKRIQEHKDKDCPKALETCIHCGTTGIVRENLPAHQESPECHSEPVVCTAGCGTFARKDYQDHFRGMHHEVFVVSKLDTTSRRLREIENLTVDTNGQFASQITQVEDRTAVLEQTVKDVTQRLRVSRVTEVTQSPLDIDRKIKQAVDQQLKSVNERIDVNTITFEGTCSDMHRKMEKTITGVEKLEGHWQIMTSELEQIKNKIMAIERTMATKDETVKGLEIRIQSLESASYDGNLLWKISDFSKKYQDAVHGRTISIYSPPFHTSRRGYKMCARLYLNGDGTGKGKYMSLFFVVMKGDFDSLLKWPFALKVTFSMINQGGGEHVIDAFTPDPRSTSFKQPTSDMNIASGCPLFIRQDIILNPSCGFLKDDTVYIKIVVDVSKAMETSYSIRREVVICCA